MKFFDKLFGRTTDPEVKQPEVVKEKKPRKPRVKKASTVIETAADKIEPRVAVTKLDFDPRNPRLGSLELDWNEEFIQLLQEHGYTGGSAEDIIDAWLNDICRNILNNQFPGAKVTNIDSARFVNRQNLGDGKTEVS